MAKTYFFPQDTSEADAFKMFVVYETPKERRRRKRQEAAVARQYEDLLLEAMRTRNYARACGLIAYGNGWIE